MVRQVFPLSPCRVRCRSSPDLYQGELLLNPVTVIENIRHQVDVLKAVGPSGGRGKLSECSGAEQGASTDSGCCWLAARSVGKTVDRLYGIKEPPRDRGRGRGRGRLSDYSLCFVFIVWLG